MTINATFKNGGFFPNEPVNVADGTPARIEFEELATDEQPWLKLAGTISPQDAKEMREAVEEAFGKVNPDDWR